MSPFELVSVVVPAHTARALHYTLTGWQNSQDKIVSPREEWEYVVTQPELTLQEPSLCKHIPTKAAVIPSTGNITGSEMLISFPVPVLHLGWQRLCQLVLQRALVWVPPLLPAENINLQENVFYSDLLQKDYG